MGIYEIRTTETLDSDNITSTILIADDNGALNIRALDVHSFKLNDSIPYVNILRLVGWCVGWSLYDPVSCLIRMWNKFCVSYDFEENQAQAAFNGQVSDLIQDPATLANMKGKFDGEIITGAGDTDKLVLIVGRYSFDKNPFIGILADINVWDRWIINYHLSL